MRRYVVSVLVGAGLAVAAAQAQAGETLPQDIAQRLDKAPVAFSMSEAKRERLMIIQENMARQGYYGGGYGGYSGYGGYGGGGYGGAYSHPGYGYPPGYTGGYGYYRHQQPPLSGLERGYYGR